MRLSKPAKKVTIAVITALLLIGVVAIFLYFYIVIYGKVEFENPDFPASSVVLAAVGRL